MACIALDKSDIKINLFQFFHKHIYCCYSFKVPHTGASSEELLGSAYSMWFCEEIIYIYSD